MQVLRADAEAAVWLASAPRPAVPAVLQEAGVVGDHQDPQDPGRAVRQGGAGRPNHATQLRQHRDQHHTRSAGLWPESWTIVRVAVDTG